jgi:hypothetical protein
MKSRRGFTDANNAWPAFSGVRRKRFSMGEKPSDTLGIITLKSFWKTCANKRKLIKYETCLMSTAVARLGPRVRSDKSKTIEKVELLIYRQK